MAKHSALHPGFAGAQNKIAKSAGVSQNVAAEILAASTRNASRSAKKINPRLKNVVK